MEEARQDAEQRLVNLEMEFERLGPEREQVLEVYTRFIFNMENEVIDYARPLEEHERVFRNFQKFRERIKKLIGQEKMYSLLGTDKDVADLHSEQKKSLMNVMEKK